MIPTKIKVYASVILVLVLVLPILFGSWYNIDEGERGVILRNGAFVGIADPGLHFKTPLIESVESITVQNTTIRWDSMGAYSKDQQPAAMSVSLTYKIPPDKVFEVYKNYGGQEGLENRVLNRIVPNQIQTSFGKYTAIESVQKRQEVVANAELGVKNEIPVEAEIVSLQIENVKFSEAYEQSVEERMRAEVAVATQRQNLEKERISAQIVETTAQGAAAATLAAAKAEAQAIELRGDAEASAIKARADALKENAQLVELVKAEKWNGALPTHVLPNSTVPFLDTK